jgi:hypothetical protein
LDSSWDVKKNQLHLPNFWANILIVCPCELVRELISVFLIVVCEMFDMICKLHAKLPWMNLPINIVWFNRCLFYAIAVRSQLSELLMLFMWKVVQKLPTFIFQIYETTFLHIQTIVPRLQHSSVKATWHLLWFRTW